MIHIKNCINLKDLNVCDSFYITLKDGKYEEIIEMLVAEKSKTEISIIPRFMIQQDYFKAADNINLENMPSFKYTNLYLKILPKYERIFKKIFNNYEMVYFGLLDVNDLYSDRKLQIFKEDRKYIASEILNEFQYGDLGTINYWVKNSSTKLGYSYIHLNGRVINNVNKMICGIRPLIKLKLK